MKLIGIVMALVIFTAVPSVLAEGVIGSNERLQEIKERSGITVSEDQKSAVIAQCAQSKIQMPAIQTAVDSAIRKRLIIYETIQKEIKAIELRMTKQGADASEIDLLIGKLQQELDTFSEHARYSQQLSEDIATIDCNASPELYRAAANEYVETRKKLYESSASLKRIITAAPNDTFARLIDRLKI